VPENEWSAILEQMETSVKQARKTGDIDALIDITQDALHQCGVQLAAGLPEAEKIKTLHAIRRIGFNVAADIYPGWELGTPARSEAQLSAATGFAQHSVDAVTALGQGAAQRGNAVWLLAALDLARGNGAGAAPEFNKAAAIFGEGPEAEMQLMALGYAAIASHSRGDFDAVIAGLKNLGTEDAADFCEQLDIASQIFAL